MHTVDSGEFAGFSVLGLLDRGRSTATYVVRAPDSDELFVLKVHDPNGLGAASMRGMSFVTGSYQGVSFDAGSPKPLDFDVTELHLDATACNGLHNSIWPVLKIGIEPVRGAPWFLYRFLVGKSIGRTVHDTGPFSPARVFSIVKALFEAIAALSERQIFHGGISPRTVFLPNSSPESVVLLDTASWRIRQRSAGERQYWRGRKILGFDVNQAIQAAAPPVFRPPLPDAPAYQEAEPGRELWGEPAPWELRSDVSSVAFLVAFLMTGVAGTPQNNNSSYSLTWREHLPAQYSNAVRQSLEEWFVCYATHRYGQRVDATNAVEQLGAILSTCRLLAIQCNWAPSCRTEKATGFGAVVTVSPVYTPSRKKRVGGELIHSNLGKKYLRFNKLPCPTIGLGNICHRSRVSDHCFTRIPAC